MKLEPLRDVFIIAFTVLFIYFFILKKSDVYVSDLEKRFRNIIIKNGYKSSVKDKLSDPDDRYLDKIILTDGSKYEICNMDAYNRIQLGDAIIKMAGSLKYTVIHEKDTFFFYPIFNGKEIKD